MVIVLGYLKVTTWSDHFDHLIKRSHFALLGNVKSGDYYLGVRQPLIYLR
jgi:hypothetical protein